MENQEAIIYRLVVINLSYDAYFLIFGRFWREMGVVNPTE